MTSKLKLAVLFGGQSHEHEVSVTSARSMLAAIDIDRYDLLLIGICQSGRWLLFDSPQVLDQGATVDAIAEQVSNVPPSVWLDYVGGKCLRQLGSERQWAVDVFFPLLHGPCGEDGTIQGVFELADVAYVGCGVAASGLAMDKALMKAAFAAAGLQQLEYLVIHQHQWMHERDALIQQVIDRISGPFFVKPANMGSSVGVRKAYGGESLASAIDHAFRYDVKVLVERSAEGCREIECAVLGNEAPQASAPGEIIPGSEFYDYDTKYVNDRSQLIIPAQLSASIGERIREQALRAFACIDGQGLARVDFFVNSETDVVWINEINTMPGFTPISMYPKMWAASGIGYAELVATLIDLALARHAAKRR